MNRACFFDRDGVINDLVFHEIKNQTTAPWIKEEFNIQPGVWEALEKTRSAGFLNLVITNQPDVLDGFVSPEDAVYFASYLKKNFAIDEIFEAYLRGEWKYKPNPGFIDLAKEMFDLDLTCCYSVGDTWKDCVFSALRNIKYVHIGSEPAIGPVRYHAKNITEAVEWILKHWKTSQ
jgi:D-glycero-D-manno-heptose 1,7-bisphosphate phosphatase